MLVAQEEYANALTLIHMFYSPPCWKIKTTAMREFEKLSSQTAKLNGVKEQIKICVKGFGCSDLHHPWPENGVEIWPEALLAHLVDNIIPQQSKHRLPSEPTINLPSCKHMTQLGTQTTDIALLEEGHKWREVMQLQRRSTYVNR